MLLTTGNSDKCITINSDANTNTGIEYINPKNNLRHLKRKDRTLVKEYISVLNKIQMINHEDRFLFVEEQATALELIIEIQSTSFFTKYSNKVKRLIENEINSINTKLERYYNDEISEFERIKAKKDMQIQNFKEAESKEELHKEYVKIISKIYNLKKEELTI